MSQSGNQKKKLSSSQNVKVVVRVRPLNNEEKDRRVKTVVQCVSMREIQTKEKKYYFDRVFEPDSSQMDIYSFVVAPMINDVLAGYNCTVFAYGQTGTGKTHTMTGGDPSLSSNVHWREDELSGCIPRVAANIFDEIGLMKVTDYNVRVSFLELYNEEVRDLLSNDERTPPLNIFNDNKGSVCIHNLNEVTVFSSNDIYLLLQQGTLKRQTAATLMNNHSSRSHTVFTITVHTREANLNGEEVLKTGKINLVDLAGSENIAKSGAKDKRAQELANINRSLLTLGRVIQILAEKNNKHVPYRDSKLTRILQDSLGGHTKTCIIATVSPCSTSYEETQSTLEYACRARDIRNTPMVNERITKAQMMKEMTHEIEKLKKDLEAARSGDGFFIDRANWEDLNSQLQSSSSALSLKNDIIEDMKKKLSDLEMIRDIKKREYEEVMNVCKHKEKIIDKAKSKLKEQLISLKQEQYVSSCYLEAANENTIKAKELLEVTKSLSKNQDILHKKLENQYLNNYTNEKTVSEKGTTVSNNMLLAITELEKVRNTTSSSFASHKVNMRSTKCSCNDYAKKSKASWKNNTYLVESEFEKHAKLIQDSTQNTIDSITSEEEKNNEMLGLVNDATGLFATAYESFESSLSNMDGMEYFITNLEEILLKERKEKEIVLLDLGRFTAITQRDIGKLDGILNSIEMAKKDWTNRRKNSVEGKLKFEEGQQRQQLLCKGLQSNIDNLGLQRQSCSESETKMLASSSDIKENINQILTDRLNTTVDFVNTITSELDSLEENVDALNQTTESHMSELEAIIHSTNELGKDIVTNIIPVQRAGDTPKQNCFNYPKRIGEGALPRDLLVKRFKEEFKEDIENQSFHLNSSIGSIGPLDDLDEIQRKSEDSSK